MELLFQWTMMIEENTVEVGCLQVEIIMYGVTFDYSIHIFMIICVHSVLSLINQ